VNLTVSHLQDLSSHEIGHIFTVGGMPEENDILLDCAATLHMFRECCCFHNYVPLAGDETISVGDKCSLAVAGQESVSFKAKLPGGI